MTALLPILRATSLLVLLGTAAWWLQKGAHRGWSQNRVPVAKIDEVTGIAYTLYENRFIPGLDVLGGGLALASILFAVTFFLRSNHNPQSPS